MSEEGLRRQLDDSFKNRVWIYCHIFSADTWQPGGDACCYLHIRTGKPSTAEKA